MRAVWHTRMHPWCVLSILKGWDWADPFLVPPKLDQEDWLHAFLSPAESWEWAGLLWNPSSPFWHAREVSSKSFARPIECKLLHDLDFVLQEGYSRTYRSSINLPVRSDFHPSHTVEPSCRPMRMKMTEERWVQGGSGCLRMRHGSRFCFTTFFIISTLSQMCLQTNWQV